MPASGHDAVSDLVCGGPASGALRFTRGPAGGSQWAEEKTRFTARFEGPMIAWLWMEASGSAAARQFGLVWGKAANIQRRGLARRQLVLPRRIGVGETSFQKRREYVTVVNDLEGRVLEVADGRDYAALDGFFEEPRSEGVRPDRAGGERHGALVYRVGHKEHRGRDRVRQVPRAPGAGTGGEPGAPGGQSGEP